VLGVPNASVLVLHVLPFRLLLPYVALKQALFTAKLVKVKEHG
jgi:hypothetical protein